MSGELRSILIFASVLTCVYISRKLKKFQVDSYGMIFWLLFSGVLILLSIFPEIVDGLAKLVGIYSPVNMVFLVIIFALLIRVFLLTIKVSQLEHKFKDLVEELAIREKSDKKE